MLPKLLCFYLATYFACCSLTCTWFYKTLTICSTSRWQWCDGGVMLRFEFSPGDARKYDEWKRMMKISRVCWLMMMARVWMRKIDQILCKNVSVFRSITLFELHSIRWINRCYEATCSWKITRKYLRKFLNYLQLQTWIFEFTVIFE